MRLGGLLMRRMGFLTLITTVAIATAGCEKKENAATGDPKADDTHVHADGSTHDGHDHGDHGHDHGHHHHGHHIHDEVFLGKVTMGDMEVTIAQGHGKVEPGKEGHIVVKLPYSDDGETVVRAWLGGKDRSESIVGKGVYKSTYEDYDIHVEAPDPLPEDVKWWVEVEKPDGTKLVTSIAPIK